MTVLYVVALLMALSAVTVGCVVGDGLLAMAGLLGVFFVGGLAALMRR